MKGAFGCWMPTEDGGVFMTCPISGDVIRGTKTEMTQYTQDMAFLGWHVRPKGKPTVGFECRRLPPDAKETR